MVVTTLASGKKQSSPLVSSLDRHLSLNIYRHRSGNLRLDIFLETGSFIFSDLKFVFYTTASNPGSKWITISIFDRFFMWISISNSMARFRCTAVTLAFALLVWSGYATIVGANPRNPCHPGRRDMGLNSTCAVVRIPPQMCTACALDESKIDSRGKLGDCLRVFHTNTTQCRRELNRYASWNPCDAQRNAQVRQYAQSLIPLDYFVYAVCEQCCDCVPIGARREQYTWRIRSGKLFDTVGRPNCGSHAAADICSVWPNVRAIVNWKTEIPPKNVLDKIPDICIPLRRWRKARVGGKNSSLSEPERNTIPGIVQPLLKAHSRAANCRAKPVWDACVRMEVKQRRI